MTGIGDGTLELDRFRHWVRQDYLFLIDYSRSLALAAARAPDLETMRRFADLAQATLGEEMELHRAYAREFEITESELEREQMAPTTRLLPPRCCSISPHRSIPTAAKSPSSQVAWISPPTPLTVKSSCRPSP